MKAMNMLGTGMIRFTGQSILPTPLISTESHVQHNPTVILHQFIAKLHNIGRYIEHYNLAMLDYLDNFDQTASMELFTATMQFQEYTFIRNVEEMREFILAVLCNIFREHNHLMPQKIRNAWNGKPIEYVVDTDFFNAVEKHYSGNIFDVRTRIIKDLGIDIIPRRYSLLKMSRLNEIRNCFVHHGGAKSTKFISIAGSKYDRTFVPRGKLRPFAPWQTLMFLIRLSSDIEQAVLSKLDLPRAFTQWPRY